MFARPSIMRWKEKFVGGESTVRGDRFVPGVIFLTHTVLVHRVKRD